MVKKKLHFHTVASEKHYVGRHNLKSKIRLIKELGFCFSDVLLVVIMHSEKHGLTKVGLIRT